MHQRVEKSPQSSSVDEMLFFPSFEYSEQIIEKSDMDPKEGQVNHPRAAPKKEHTVPLLGIAAVPSIVLS
jgi:hypothetical protein